jgi:ribosomal protein L11 methyltransferase
MKLMREIGSGLWQATMRLDDAPAEAFLAILDDGAAGLSAFETELDNPAAGWTVTALYRARPDAGALQTRLALAAAALGVPEPAVELAPLAPADWLERVYAGFPPRRIGRFYVHGSHIPAPSGGVIGLRIDAATAFGSGEHASTEGCLMAISNLAKRRPEVRRALDMGCGSGILAIAVAKLFPSARVIAIDIDPESAAVAAGNARLNRVGSQVRAARGDGYLSPLAATGRRFDVIIANILARPLIRMAPSLGRRLRPGGVAILSGLLGRQEAGVLSAHRSAGLVLAGREKIGDWHTLILRRP